MPEVPKVLDSIPGTTISQSQAVVIKWGKKKNERKGERERKEKPVLCPIFALFSC